MREDGKGRGFHGGMVAGEGDLRQGDVGSGGDGAPPRPPACAGAGAAPCLCLCLGKVPPRMRGGKGIASLTQHRYKPAPPHAETLA